MPGIFTRLIGGDLAALAADPLGEFVRRSRQGGVVPLEIGLARGHLVSDPAIVRHVLLDNIDNYDKHTPAFDAVRVVLGNGMLTSGGAFWKRQRRITQPAFHGESVRHFALIISWLAAETADEWERATAAGRPAGRRLHRHDARHAPDRGRDALRRRPRRERRPAGRPSRSAHDPDAGSPTPPP